MFTLLKMFFALAIVVPLVLLATFAGGVMLAVLIGVAAAIIGIAFFLVKVAFFVVLPVMALAWLATRLFSRGGDRRRSADYDVGGYDVNEWA